MIARVAATSLQSTAVSHVIKHGDARVGKLGVRCDNLLHVLIAIRDAEADSFRRVLPEVSKITNVPMRVVVDFF